MPGTQDDDTEFDRDRRSEDKGQMPNGQVRHALKKLLDAVESGEITIFDRREARALQSWARFLLAVQSMGMAADLMRNIVIWIGGLIFLYYALKGNMPDWVKLVGGWAK